MTAPVIGEEQADGWRYAFVLPAEFTLDTAPQPTDPKVVLAPLEGRFKVVTQVKDMLEQIQNSLAPGDHVVFMSNGGFESAPGRLAESLRFS